MSAHRIPLLVVMALGACLAPTRDDDHLVSGTVALVIAEPQQQPGPVRAGPFVSVIDRLNISVTDGAGLVIGSASIQLQRYDSTASTTIELPEGLATFTAEVLSNTGALLYRGTTPAEVREGFTVEVPIVAQRPVMVILPDTLKTTGSTTGQFIVYNAGSQPLGWRLASIDNRLCGDGCSVQPTSGTVQPHQAVTFTAFISLSMPTSVFSFVASSNEGDVPIRWAHTRPTITSVAVSPPTAVIRSGDSLRFTATVVPSTPVFWSSSDFGTAIPRQNGWVIGGSKIGITYIHAISQVDNTKRDSARVTVTAVIGDQVPNRVPNHR